MPQLITANGVAEREGIDAATVKRRFRAAQLEPVSTKKLAGKLVRYYPLAAALRAVAGTVDVARARDKRAGAQAQLLQLRALVRSNVRVPAKVALPVLTERFDAYLHDVRNTKRRCCAALAQINSSLTGDERLAAIKKLFADEAERRNVALVAPLPWEQKR
jgi:hypothetical protein